jgi:hypothetical protein
MPPAAPAAQNPNIGVAPKNQPAVGASLNNERLASRAGAGTAAGEEETGEKNAQAGTAQYADEQETAETEDELEIGVAMQQERQKKINAEAQKRTQEKAEKTGQAITAAVGKNPWGRALLLGIKYILKVVSLFGPSCVGFVVTAWVITIPLNLLFCWIPIFGSLIAGFFAAIFAVPFSSIIYPKLKPYVDEITKQTSLLPKASQVKGGTKLPGR